MFYSAIAIVFILLGLVGLLGAARVLLHRGWLLGWLRGMLGLGILSVGLLIGLMAFDIFSYQQILTEKSLATISFEKVASQKYNATLVDGDGNEQRFELYGDQWQLDARLVKWSGALAGFGIKPGYRLDRISGRYFSLEDERNAKRSVYALTESPYGIDLWAWLNQSTSTLPWIDAVYGNAAFVPMEDGALFEVTLSHTGLLARPLNDPAKDAVTRWQ
ncbi:cation/multidrug efflux pump [Exilibacterium tricleocarpae]|uniref:Cation/multidrug efflux pump n=1 Tax=Exilibacterium tricleocarpae TaxID=2591008 RepID=A0A545TVQ3_9GAMM|nr:cation/multidrug efflux pump [Exilibacterium tricleocarpae]TQV81293.1 cation/multidrug efflux pump [Exilibacterium tricleocarpae]